MYDPKIVSFGYIDLFKNDHEILKDKSLPYFLIFKEGNPEPIEI